MLKTERPILFLDLESTGVDVCNDRIVELGVTVLHPDGKVNPRGWSRRFNPGIPIPAEATAIHGISDADVADCPPFSTFAPTFHQRLRGKDLAGYNLSRFDLVILDEEFRRVGLRLDLSDTKVIDAAAIYFKKRPRTLADCVREFCGREPEGSHGAGIDTAESMEALLGEFRAFPDLASLSVADLAKYADLNDKPRVDIAGNLYRDEEGHVCFGFGKNKGKRVVENSGYVRWMAEKGQFPGSTMDAIQEEFDRQGEGRSNGSKF